jgi:flagellar hook assembly protein FlgD
MDRAKVTLRVYDVSGRIGATLIEGVGPAGRHELQWDGRTSGGRSAASGTYFVRMEAPGFMEVRQLTLVR